MKVPIPKNHIVFAVWSGLVILCGLAAVGLYETRAQADVPQITTASVVNGTLSVKGQNFSAGARIEVDGTALADTKAPAGNPSKKLKSRQGGALAVGSYVVTVRNADNRRSAPFLLDNQATQKPKVTLTITSATLRVPVGTTLQLTATARDAAGGELTGVAFSWTSAAPSVASVDSSGVVRGVTAGTSRITLSALRNDTSVDVTVEGGGGSGTPASITIDPANPVVNESETLQLKAQVRDASGNPLTGVPVSWSSDNESQIKIDQTGLVTAVKRGFAAVTVKAGNVQTIISVSAVKVENSVAGSGSLGEVRTDLANRVYQTDVTTHVVRRGVFGKPLDVYTGKVGVQGKTDGTLQQALFSGPLGMGIDNQNGQVFIADTANQVLRSVRPDGQVVTVAGTSGLAGYKDGPVREAQFRSPGGAVVGQDGVVYVADSGNHVIRAIDLRKGVVTTVAGTPGTPGKTDGRGTSARFNFPRGLALDANNRNIVVADTENGAVRLVTPTGEVTTVGFLSREARATVAYGKPQNRRAWKTPVEARRTVRRSDDFPAFDHPIAVGVDAIGTIYVADRNGVQVIARAEESDALAVFPLADADALGTANGVDVTSVEGTFAGGTRANGIIVNSVRDGKAELSRVTVGVPSITGLTPNRAPVSGGTTVTVNGVNFTPDMQVFLDGDEIEGLTIVSSRAFTFVTPRVAESGIRTITVQGRGGTRQFPFLIEPPSVESLKTGDITTLLGGTTFVGDGGDALQATLAGPGGVAVDDDGNLLFADFYNNRIRRVDVETNIISTVAGRGTVGNSGDGGPATAAALSAPQDVAIDFDGNIYIADLGNSRIRRIDAETGVITTFAGSTDGFGGDGGPAVQAKLSSPTGVAVDFDGNVYIADNGNNVIRKVDADGRITTVAGTGEPGYAGDGGPATQAKLGYPSDITVDFDGNLYLADRTNNVVRRVDPDGIITTVVGNGVAGNLDDPFSVEFDFAGALLITDLGNSCVKSFDLESEEIEIIAGREGESGFAGDGGDATQALLSLPLYATSDGAGNVYVADGFNNRVREVNAEDGTIDTFAGTGGVDISNSDFPESAMRVYYPEGLETDRDGNLYVCEPFIGRVRRFEPATQRFRVFAGFFDFNQPATGNGKPATEATFIFPTRMTLDAAGNAYIMDGDDGTIRRVDRNLTVQAFAGASEGNSGDGVPALQAGLRMPSGAAFGPDGNLYFADRDSHRVRRINVSTGIIETVAGNGQPGFAGDGRSATSANLFVPTDVAFDRAGNLYVADWGNNRVRRIDRGTQVITTVAGNGNLEFNGDGVQAVAASMDPFSVSLDGADRLLITDRSNNRIRMVESSGVIRTIAGNGQEGMNGDGIPAVGAALFFPTDAIADRNGNLIVSDYLNNRVRLVKGVVTPTRN